jgi:hypothetical protein
MREFSTQFVTHTGLVIAGRPFRGSDLHDMSVGHSAPYELGVHRRTQLPPAPSAGTAAQNVSA